MVDRSAMKLAVVASAGVEEELLSALKDRFSLSTDASLGDTMAARVIREKEAVMVNDVRSMPTALGRKYVEYGIHCMAILPLIVSDESVGVLSLYASESEFFHEEEMKLLGELSGNIAYALEHIANEEKSPG